MGENTCKLSRRKIRSVPGEFMLEWCRGVVHVLGLEADESFEGNHLMACDGYVTRPHFGVALGSYAHVLVHLPSGTPIESSRDVDELKALAAELVRAFDADGLPYEPTRELLKGMLALFRFEQKRQRSRVFVRPVTHDVGSFERMMGSLELDLCALLFSDAEPVRLATPTAPERLRAGLAL